MFTGIITEIGRVLKIERLRGAVRLGISANKAGLDLKIGDSVAVNGVCLSIVDKRNGLFFDVVENTFQRTNLRRLKKGDKVNLEKPLIAGDAISGHMVSGHSDGERSIRNNSDISRGWLLEIDIGANDRRYLVPKGSVAVDGVSLTIAEIYPTFFRIFLIPQTIKDTTLKEKRRGDHVNIEFDMLLKQASDKSQRSSITREFLAQKGFI